TLARFLPGPLAQLVDHLGREMTLQLPRYRRSLLVDLWTRRLTSCSSLLHRAPFVGRFATKPTKEWPDLFPLSRYVTRKGSGDAIRPDPCGSPGRPRRPLETPPGRCCALGEGVRGGLADSPEGLAGQALRPRGGAAPGC